MTSLAEAFGLGRGCFGREGVLRCTGTFPETGGMRGKQWCPLAMPSRSKTALEILYRLYGNLDSAWRGDGGAHCRAIGE